MNTTFAARNMLKLIHCNVELKYNPVEGHQSPDPPFQSEGRDQMEENGKKGKEEKREMEPLV